MAASEDARWRRCVVSSVVAVALLGGCGMAAAPPGGRRDGSAELTAFPWPPPRASASMLLPQALLDPHGTVQTLGDVDHALRNGLTQVGYVDTSYRWAPSGFVLVTAIERIERDGTPRLHDRFSINAPVVAVSHFSLKAYLRALFTADPGRYRVLAFVVTDVPFDQENRPVTEAEVAMWTSGPRWLPDAIASIRWTPRVHCAALIYEFIREQEREPKLLGAWDGALDASTHLRAVGLLDPWRYALLDTRLPDRRATW